ELAVVLCVDGADLGAGENLDALLFERLARQRRDFGVLDGKDLRQYFDDGHVRAQGAEERGELDADRARADHQQRLRNPVRYHRLEIGPDQLLVRLDPGQYPRARAGREDDVLGLIRTRTERALRRIVPRLHRDLAGRVDRRLAPDHLHLVLLHQEAAAVVEPFRNGARALHDRFRVVADFFGREPVVLRVLEIVENLGRAQQRLGRNAAPIQADATEVIALDDSRLESELR